jgi:hypothetical protein
MKQPASSAILMRAIRDEQPSTQRARSRLRHKLSLALVLAALLFALLALVGPSSGEPPRRVVLVLDASASMGARDAVTGDVRLTRARTAIAGVIENLSQRDEVALVAIGAEAGLLMPPTRRVPDVLARIDALVARGAAGDNRDDALAFRLADGLCKDPEHTTLVVISDGAGLAVPPTRCPVAHLPIGGHVDNSGISALAVRSVDGMGVYDVHIAVASTANDLRRNEVTFTADGNVVDIVTLDVPPSAGEARDVFSARDLEAGIDLTRTVRLTIEQGRTLTARLAGKDGLALDDEATVALPDDGPVSVLLVTSRPASLMAEVLRLHPRVRLTVADAAGGALPPEAVDLIVLEDDPKAALPPSPHVVGFGVAPAGAPLALGKAATELNIVRWDYDAPWFRYVELREVFITSAQVVTGGSSVVDSASGALAASARWDDRELFVTGFGGDQTDLALRAAFPNLIANLVDWAAPRGEAPPPPVGVLSAAESHAAPALDALPGEAFAARAGWADDGRLLRYGLALAVLLLCVEQILTMRRKGKVTP